MTFGERDALCEELIMLMIEFHGYVEPSLQQEIKALRESELRYTIAWYRGAKE